MNKTQYNGSSQTLMIEIHVLDKARKGSNSEDKQTVTPFKMDNSTSG